MNVTELEAHCPSIQKIIVTLNPGFLLLFSLPLVNCKIKWDLNVYCLALKGELGPKGRSLRKVELHLREKVTIMYLNKKINH